MTSDDNELSNRELEILRLVATGASNKEIASHLYISANTVKVHLRNIFSKIGVNSRTEAAMYAVNAGIISPTDQGQDIRRILPGDELGGQPISPDDLVQPKRSRRGVTIVGWIIGVLVFIVFLSYAIYALRQLLVQQTAQPLLPDQAQRWQDLAKMPSARSDLAVAVIESDIFAIGGLTADGVTKEVEKYDTGSNTWSVATEKPTAVFEASAIAVGGRIYVPGGKLSSGELTDVLEIFDPILGQWTRGASLPVAMSAYALTSLEGRIYVFGGWDGKNFLDKVYRYDPQADSWEERTSLPSPRGYASAAITGAKIYVVGGFDGRKTLRANDIYQPELDMEGSNPWSSGKLLPSGRKDMGVVSIADILVVIGGIQDEEQSAPSLMYFTNSNEWQVFESLTSQPWKKFAVASVGSYVYILGGELNGKPSDLAFSYLAIYTLSIPIVK